MGRKGREAIRSGPVLLGEDTEEEGDYTDSQIVPRESVVQSTYWVPQPWGPTPGGQVPLAVSKTNGTYRRVVINIDSACEEHAHICLFPKHDKVN